MNLSSRPQFVITGGHHNSALVVAQALVKRGYRVAWIGHRYATARDIRDSAEYTEVSAAGIPFYSLRAGKLGISVSVGDLGRIPLGLLRAHRLLGKLHPIAVISFGGYLGFAVSLAGFFRRIPVFLHEQTVVAGKANRFTAIFARRVYLTWESSRRFFPRRKSLVVGLPLRNSILYPSPRRLFSNSLPTLLVLGGKLGSHALNLFLFSHLRQLLTRYNLIHQTGTSSVTGDYARALSLRHSLPRRLKLRYRPVGYLSASQLGVNLGNCDLYLGRSGAHITYELAVLGTRALLVPFLQTSRREQLQNARFLARAGSAKIISQSRLSYQALSSRLRSCLRLPRPAPLSLPRNATAHLLNDLFHALSL